MINDNLIQNILVAIDGSEHSPEAVKVLSDLYFRSLSSRRKCLLTAYEYFLLGMIIARSCGLSQVKSWLTR